MDVTGIEPVTPCLQSTGLVSIPSIHYYQLLTFPTNRGTCFSLEAIPMASKCCILAQSVHIAAVEPLSSLPLVISKGRGTQLNPEGLFRLTGKEYPGST